MIGLCGWFFTVLIYYNGTVVPVIHPGFRNIDACNNALAVIEYDKTGAPRPGVKVVAECQPHSCDAPCQGQCFVDP